MAGAGAQPSGWLGVTMAFPLCPLTVAYAFTLQYFESSAE